MSLTGILLGLLDIAIVVVILLLIGAIAIWILGYLGWSPPPQVQKLYIALVALIALAMIIALLLGVPRLRIIGHGQSNYPAIGAIAPAPPDITVRES
jgi:hypothetical protein